MSLLKNRKGKQMKKSFLKLLGMCIAAAALGIVLLVGFLNLIGVLYQWLYGEEAVWLVTAGLNLVPWAVVLILASLDLPEIQRMVKKEDEEAEQNEAVSDKTAVPTERIKTRRIFWKINIPAVLLIAAIGLIICVAEAFWHNRFTPDGVEIHHFFSKKAYTWDEVDYYTLKAKSGILRFELVMKDGEKISFVDSNAEYISDAFYEMFPDDVYDYSVWLAQNLKNHGKELRVEDWEYLHEKLDYESWDELADAIREAAGNSESPGE